MDEFNLKSFRETLNLSQAELADKIGRDDSGNVSYNQSTISRWEANPGTIPYDALKRMAKLAGVSIDELTNYQKPTVDGLIMDNTWRYPSETGLTIDRYVQTFLETHSLASEDDQCIKAFHKTVKAMIRKPKVAFVGRSDVGKSTMINSLLGTEKMPTSWTPTTSIIVYIKHVSDRPAYLKENECFVFQASPKDNTWADWMLEDEELAKETLICEGSASLLQDYGTRQGNKELASKAVAAVLYLKSDILNNCDLMDVPGYGTGDRDADDKMTLEAKQQADVLIYLSLAAAFLRPEDNAYLTEAISSLRPICTADEAFQKPLANLYIVASQAQMVADSSTKGPNGRQSGMASLANILDSGCDRLELSLPDEYLSMYITKEDEQADAHAILRSRFFYYAKDRKEYNEAFYQDLRQLLEYLPYQLNENLLAFLRQTKDTETSPYLYDLTSQVNQYAELLEEHSAFAKKLRNFEKEEPARKQAQQKARSHIRSVISSCSTASSREFLNVYNQVLNEDFIIAVIERKNFKKKKEDMLALSNYISALLDSRMRKILKCQGENLSEEVEKYVNGFNPVNIDGSGKQVNVDMFGFDARRIFASGLAGAATYGGLAFWASTCGNLGAYILIAKGVSVLSSIGISTGGTAAAVSAVASIGGPVVLGVALAVLAAMGIFAVFSGGWKKSLAKNLVKAFAENNVGATYGEVIEKYWQDTQAEFDKAADNMEKEWQSLLKNLRSSLDSCSEDDLRERIAHLNETKSFFENIPE